MGGYKLLYFVKCKIAPKALVQNSNNTRILVYYCAYNYVNTYIIEFPKLRS